MLQGKSSPTPFSFQVVYMDIYSFGFVTCARAHA